MRAGSFPIGIDLRTFHVFGGSVGVSCLEHDTIPFKSGCSPLNEFHSVTFLCFISFFGLVMCV